MDFSKLDILKVSLTTAINMIQEKHYTNPMIGEVIDVTPLQVHYYHRGKTKNPSPIICMAILTGFVIDGKSLLVDIYKNVDDLEQHYKVHKERKNVT